MRFAACALFVALLLGAVPAPPQSPLPERFAMRARATGNNRPVRVELNIERWSDSVENERLFDSLATGGVAALKAALQDSVAVGEMRVEAVRSYPLQFAREFADEDGGRRILLATAQPIGFQGGEGYFLASGRALTLIELRLDSDGDIDGAAEVTETVDVDPELRAFGLSGATTGSVRLSSVRRLSSQ
jgi:hypothetical protein